MSNLRRCLPILAVLAAGALRAQTPDATPAGTPPPPAKPSRAELETELAMYSPLESPWSDLKANHASETHLFNLMRAEVRLWALPGQLTAQDGAARENVEEISRIIHAQILGGAAEALPLLQKTPNKPFALLLVHQLEAYPYEWQEEGSDELLPDLRKLIDPPAGSPAPRPVVRRRRRRSSSNGDDGERFVPTAPAVPKSAVPGGSPGRP